MSYRPTNPPRSVSMPSMPRRSTSDEEEMRALIRAMESDGLDFSQRSSSLDFLNLDDDPDLTTNEDGLRWPSPPSSYYGPGGTAATAAGKRMLSPVPEYIDSPSRAVSSFRPSSPSMMSYQSPRSQPSRSLSSQPSRSLSSQPPSLSSYAYQAPSYGHRSRQRCVSEPASDLSSRAWGPI